MTGGVEGVAETVRALDSLSSDLDTLAAFDTLADLGAQAVRDATPTRTRALLGTVRVEPHPNQAVVTAGGPTVTYAGHVNYGTRSTPARHYLQQFDAALTDARIDQVISDDLNALTHQNGLT